jgi:hypothetical protein
MEQNSESKASSNDPNSFVGINRDYVLIFTKRSVRYKCYARFVLGGIFALLAVALWIFYQANDISSFGVKSEKLNDEVILSKQVSEIDQFVLDEINALEDSLDAVDLEYRTYKNKQFYVERLNHFYLFLQSRKFKRLKTSNDVRKTLDSLSTEIKKMADFPD